MSGGETRKVRLQGKPQDQKFLLDPALEKEKKRRRREDGEENEESKGTEKESLIGRSGRTMTK
jgi:hypothetical protein